MANNMDGWVTVEAWCEAHEGEHKGTIQKRVHDGLWIRGEHYSAPDGGQAYVHVKRAEAWLAARGKLVL